MSWAGWQQRVLVLVAGGLALGCPLRLAPSIPGVPMLADCPGALVPTGEITGAFLLRQDIRLRSEGLDVGLRLVVQKKGPRLVLVGFTTLGLKAFTVVQEGTATTVDAPLGPAWGVPPLNLLRDLHRARFLGVPGGPFAGGEVQTTRDGLTISERWENNVLVTRSLERAGDDPGDAVLVTFTADAVTIAHGACGYEATIVTTEKRLLQAPEHSTSRRGVSLRGCG